MSPWCADTPPGRSAKSAGRMPVRGCGQAWRASKTRWWWRRFITRWRLPAKRQTRADVGYHTAREVSATERSGGEMAGYRVNFADLGWNSWAGELPGRVKYAREGGQQVRMMELGPGFVEPEWCERGHIVYVVSGRYMQQVENETWEMVAGQALILSPGTRHRSRNTGSLAAVVFVVDLEDPTSPEDKPATASKASARKSSEKTAR